MEKQPGEVVLDAGACELHSHVALTALDCSWSESFIEIGAQQGMQQPSQAVPDAERLGCIALWLLLPGVAAV